MKLLFTQFVIMIMNDILFNVMPRYDVYTYIIIIPFTSARNIRFARQTLLGTEKVLAVGTPNVAWANLTQRFSLQQNTKALRAGRGIPLHFFRPRHWRWAWGGVITTPRPLYPRGKTRYPLYRGLGGPQCRSGWVRKISPPQGFNPRTVQHVAQSLYRLSYPGT
jgi:hypothetical protein